MKKTIAQACTLAAVVLAVGCSPPVIPRGSLVPAAQLQGQQARLEAYSGELYQQGRVAEAFYVVEVEKNRQMAAVTHGSVVAGRSADVAAMVQGGGGGDTRGIRLEPAAAPRESGAVIDDSAFWQAHAINEARADAVAERMFPPGLTLKGRAVITTLEEVQRLLQDGELMISFFVAGEAVHAVAITNQAARAVRLQAPASALRGMTDALVADVRDPRSQRWWESAAQVYGQLLGLFEAELGAAKALVVIPHGFLANVPFAVLVDGQRRPLLSRMEVRYLPTASLYRASLERQTIGDAPRMLAVANAAYPAPWPRLPAAELEGRTLWRVFPGSRLMVGAEATEEAFYEAYRGYNILHFATHGLLTAGAQGAAFASLVMTPSGQDDGYLSAQEIAALDLSATQLTVLSACETSVSGGGKRLDSIAAAFLRAGSPRVVGSQWQVSDDATALLMLKFYDRYVEDGSARALRQAQLALADSERYGHPFFWAAFVYFGAAR